MTENIKDSFVKVINDRLSNQFISAFCISWCVVNFDYIVALIKISDFNKFAEYVSVKVFPDHAPMSYAYLCLGNECEKWVHDGLLLPLVLSVSYVLLSPFSRLFIIFYHGFHESLVGMVERFWSANGVPSVAESSGLRSKLDVKEKEYEALLLEKISLEVSLDEYKEELEAATCDLSSLQSCVPHKSVDDIFEDQLVCDVFKFMCKVGGLSAGSYISKAVKLNDAKVESLMTQLVKHDYVIRLPGTGGDADYNFTQKARRAAVKANKRARI